MALARSARRVTAAEHPPRMYRLLVVECQCADALLHDGPHRLARVADDPHEAEPGDVAGRDRPEVRLEECRFGIDVEAVVGGEVAEIEHAVVHTRVLPVEQPDATFVVPEDVKAARLERLQTLLNEQATAFALACVGREFDVLFFARQVAAGADPRE